MLTTPISTAYRYMAYAAIVVALYGFAWLQGAHHEQLKAAKFEGGVAAIGQEAVKHVLEVKNQQKANLKEVTNELNRNKKIIAANAVVNFNAHYGMHINPSESGLSAPASGIKGNDAAIGTIVATDSAFIKGCASAVSVLTGWQEWASLNHIPVE